MCGEKYTEIIELVHDVAIERHWCERACGEAVSSCYWYNNPLNPNAYDTHMGMSYFKRYRNRGPRCVCAPRNHHWLTHERVEELCGGENEPNIS